MSVHVIFILKFMPAIFCVNNYEQSHHGQEHKSIMTKNHHCSVRFDAVGGTVHGSGLVIHGGGRWQVRDRNFWLNHWANKICITHHLNGQ